MSTFFGCSALLTISEAARISVHGEANSLHISNNSETALTRPCVFTFYMGGCDTDHYMATIEIPLGACVPDGHGGSSNVMGDEWLNDVGSNGCRPADNAPTYAWVQVHHYPNEDCSGQADRTHSSSASTGWPGGCNIGCLGTPDNRNDHTKDCFGLLGPGPECSESLLHAGWDCYNDVMWAKNTGFHQHPEWYNGLTASSSVEDFHRHVSQLPAHKCAPPCYQSKSTCSISLSMSEQSSDRYWCGGSLGFEATESVCTPDGHGGANIVSAGGRSRIDVCPDQSGVVSVTHFDNPLCTGEGNHHYSSFMDGGCMVGSCCNQDASRCDLSCRARPLPDICDHISPESDCAGQLRWAMTEGVSNHPEWYTGLTADSSFLDFQRYLSGMPMCSDNGGIPPCYGASDPCPVPCS